MTRMAGVTVLNYIAQMEAACAEAYQYVDYLNLEGVREDESAHGFRERIAGELRSRGMIVEAHEALQGRRYDDPNGPPMGHRDSVLTGVAGSLANASHGNIMRSPDALHEVGDELALGVLATNRDPREDALAAAFALLGPSAMDLLGGGR